MPEKPPYSLETGFDYFYFLTTFAMIALVVFLAVESSSSPEAYPEDAEKPDDPINLRTDTANDLNYIYKANRTVWTDGTGVKIPYFRISTNSEGLRGEEFSREKPGNTTRILVLGDSLTFGHGLNISDVYTSVLETKLNDEKPGRFQVINAGIPGYSAEDYYLFFRERGVSYSPDVVIVAFQYNDVMTRSLRQRFTDEAKQNVPENAENRREKINREVYELKEEYEETHGIMDSNATAYLSRIVELADRNDAKPVLYRLEPIRGEEKTYFESFAENHSTQIIFPPEQFYSIPREEYSISDEDPHFDARANQWIADELFKEINWNVSG